MCCIFLSFTQFCLRVQQYIWPAVNCIVIFKAPALWADAFIKLQCVSIYIYIYLFVPFSLGLSLALRLHDQFKASHWSTLLKSFLAAVLLSASVKRCFVSRTRDLIFFFSFSNKGELLFSSVERVKLIHGH